LHDAWRLHKQRLEAVPTDNTVSVRDAVFEPVNGMAFYSQGLLTGILNPKSALFFMAFFPLLMHRDGNIAVQWITLTVVYSVVSIAWYGSLVLFIGKLRRFLVRHNTQEWLKAVTGTILLGMRLKIATRK
jgi:threonine/homoserine/homoserine lactone efflux protein